MQRRNAQLTLVGALGWLALCGLWGCGSSGEGGDTDGGDGATRSAYVGSEVCGECHPTQLRDELEQSGHPYKITKIVNGQAPRFSEQTLRGPYDVSAGPPAGFTWADVTYLIGGYGWKYRIVDKDGYVVTGTGVQWNMRTRRWVNYKNDTPRGTLAFDYACWQCHTTGAQDGTDDLSTHQDGLPGAKGTFHEVGIRCEACHGPGAEHAAMPTRDNIVYDPGTGPSGTTPTRMVVNDNDDLPPLIVSPGSGRSRQADRLRALTCGECHTREGLGKIAVKANGFGDHHEQFEELMASGPHSLLDCVTCHDPHRGTVYNESGIRRDCESCHGNKTVNHAPGVECVDCHMPYQVESGDHATAYEGDVRSHIFRLRTTPEPRAAMYEPDGKHVALDGDGLASLTLDWACYGCHQDSAGNGGTGSVKTLDELAAKAETIHSETD